MQSSKKSDYASYAQALCGIALRYFYYITFFLYLQLAKRGINIILIK